MAILLFLGVTVPLTWAFDIDDLSNCQFAFSFRGRNSLASLGNHISDLGVRHQ